MWSRWTSAMAERQRSPTWWQAGSSRLTLWLSHGPHAVLPDVPRGDPRSVASSPPGGGRGPLSKVAPFTEKETEAQRGDSTPLMSHSKYMRPGMGTWDPSALLPGLRPPHGPGTPCWPGASVGSLRRILQKDRSHLLQPCHLLRCDLPCLSQAQMDPPVWGGKGISGAQLHTPQSSLWPRGVDVEVGGMRTK